MFRQPFEGDYPITLRFGELLECMYTEQDPHRGIDYACPEGTPVLAADDGIVINCGKDYSGYGIMVLIRHNGSKGTLYAHLSDWRVKIGQKVSKGDVIGISGNSGNSTGPHLHFEARENYALYKTAYDPIPEMQSVPAQYDKEPMPDTEQVIGLHAGLAVVSCSACNIRDRISYDAVGLLHEGSIVNISDEVVQINNLPYRKATVEVLIAEYDPYGTVILKNI